MLWLDSSQNCGPEHVQMQGAKNSLGVYVHNTPNLQHHIRMLYGNSTLWVGTEIWAVPVVGIRQGNGAGPHTWAVVSTPILDLLWQEGYGVAFQAPVSSNQIWFVRYSFVDNTDLIQTGPTIHSTATKTLLLMQAALDLWNQGLSTTRGIGPREILLVLDRLQMEKWKMAICNERSSKWSINDEWSQKPKATISVTTPIRNKKNPRGLPCPRQKQSIAGTNTPKKPGSGWTILEWPIWTKLWLGSTSQQH